LAKQRRRSDNLGWNFLDILRRISDAVTAALRPVGSVFHWLWPF
jgi:hypothetical protein